MKIRFNNETIIQLRDDIEKIICKNKDNLEDSNVRIHIDSDVLDRLLFDYDKEDNKKRPVWSGSFLRYIDLSEISFEDVCWSKIGRQKNSRYVYVVYCNTNAKIDFSKSYEAKRYGGNYEIFNCDFSNTEYRFI